MCLAEVPAQVTALRRPIELIAAAYTLGPYGGPVGALVRLGKYRPAESLLGLIGRTLAETLPPFPVDYVVATPTPLWRRLRRGFNPAELLAAPLAQRLDRPLIDALSKSNHTAQALLTRQNRSAVQGHVHQKRPVTGHILLVDDVVTTGSTAQACARVLLEGGAASVTLLTAASAVRGP